MTDSNHQNKELSIHKGSGPTESINPEFRRKSGSPLSIEDYVNGIRAGDRSILSRAITLIESTRPEYRQIGERVLEKCMPGTGNSLRIGITGIPGVGKSTFIEGFGNLLMKEGEKVAVLAIDPSSSRSRGSILGDKTRMPGLSSNEQAFIRPSPASGTLGGVARTSRETMLLCEAAGFDLILIETVGVGQSETTVHSMVDFFLLLMLAGTGDELQGIKRGIMEMADLIAINKIDEQPEQLVKKAKRDIANALSLFPPSLSGWKPPVLTCSALKQTGINKIWLEIKKYRDMTHHNGFFKSHRSDQLKHWMYETINNELKDRFFRDTDVKKMLSSIEKKVIEGEISPFRAADELLKEF